MTDNGAGAAMEPEHDDGDHAHDADGNVVVRIDDAPQDGDPADLTASDRFIVPPGTSVEMGERMGMFDKNGKLDTSSAMYDLIAKRDAGKLNHVKVVVAGLDSWLTERGYRSLAQARGSLSQANAPDPSAFERANYMKALVGYSSDWTAAQRAARVTD